MFVVIIAWLFLSCFQSRLQQELKKVPKLQKFWNLIKKKYDKMDADAAELYYYFLHLVLQSVLTKKCFSSFELYSFI